VEADRAASVLAKPQKESPVMPAAAATEHFSVNPRWRLSASGLWAAALLVPTAFLYIAVSSGSARWSQEIPYWSYNLAILAMMVPATVMILSAGGLDLSILAVMGLSAAVMDTLILRWHFLPTSAIVLALLSAGLIGLFHGVMVGLVRIPGVVATLIGMFLAIGLPQYVLGRSVAPGGSVDHYRPVFGYLALAVAVLGSIALLHLTGLGRGPANKGRQESLLKRTIRTGTPYMLSSVLAGFAGVLSGGWSKLPMATVGQLDLLLLILPAVIIGGTLMGRHYGSIIGALVALVMLSLLDRELSMLPLLNREFIRNELPNGVAVFIKGIVLLLGCGASYTYYAHFDRMYHRRRISTGAGRAPDQPGAPESLEASRIARFAHRA
jgi:ribose/xylose/arabinose/galactoside ABC-type transport system permease subunit